MKLFFRNTENKSTLRLSKNSNDQNTLSLSSNWAWNSNFLPKSKSAHPSVHFKAKESICTPLKVLQTGSWIKLFQMEDPVLRGRLTLNDSRDGVVKRDHGAADHSNVHDIPVVPQVRPWMQHKTTIQDLSNAMFTLFKRNDVFYLEANFTGEGYCEYVVCLT